MDTNPFAELQSYQLGQSLMGAPAVPTPAAQPEQPALPMANMPPAAQPATQPDSIPQRVEGWRSALGELQANPALAMALIQLGTSVGRGRGFSDSIADSLGAAGRAGDIANAYGKQKLAEQEAKRKGDLEERKFGLDEKELALRSELWKAQAARYAQLARGGGGGGRAGAAVPRSPEQVAAEIDALVQRGFSRQMAEDMVAKRDYKYTRGRYSPEAQGPTPAKAEQQGKEMNAILGTRIPTAEDEAADRARLQALRDANLGTISAAPTATAAPATGGPQIEYTKDGKKVYKFASKEEAEAARANRQLEAGSLVLAPGLGLQKVVPLQGK